MTSAPDGIAPDEIARLAWRDAVDRALAPIHRAAAHDLRSLLNAVRLNTTVLRRTLASGDGDRWLGVVESETARLDQLLAAYLKLTVGRADASAVAETNDPSTALLTAEPLLACLAQKRRVDWRLTAEPASGAWPSGVAPAALATACLVLEATEADGTARADCRSHDGTLRLSVEGGKPEAQAVDALWSPFHAHLELSTDGWVITLEESP